MEPEAKKDESQKYFRGWIYARAGDYHRNPNPHMSYTPTFLRKMKFIRGWLDALDPSLRILDAGCGEGILVEDYRAKGRQIEGLDLNYESEFVRLGNVCKMPFEAEQYDVVMMLDVFEHLQFLDQPKALAEVRRVLKPGGLFVAAIPNMAHLNSRFRFLFKGLPDRCDLEDNHPGERPMAENRHTLEENGFRVQRIKGITLTVPWLYRRVICKHAASFRWLHDALECLARPSVAMLDIFICKKG